MITGIAVSTAVIFLRDAAAKGFGQAAADTGAGVSGLGGGIGNTLSAIGQGFNQFGSGVGSGVAGLFNPLFTLRDLIYGPQAGQQAAPTAATEGSSPPTQNQSTSTAGNQSSIVTPRGSLNVLNIFNPEEVARAGVSIRGTPISPNAISLRQPTYGGVLTTSAGGTRNIRGSEALFQRLAANLSR